MSKTKETTDADRIAELELELEESRKLLQVERDKNGMHNEHINSLRGQLAEAKSKVLDQTATATAPKAEPKRVDPNSPVYEVDIPG